MIELVVAEWLMLGPSSSSRASTRERESATRGAPLLRGGTDVDTTTHTTPINVRRQLAHQSRLLTH